MSSSRPNFVVAITGASGAVYGVRLINVLLSAGCDVQLSISPAGQAVLKQELGVDVELDAERFRVENLVAEGNAKSPAVGAAHARGEVRYYHYGNLFAPLASGSARTAGMVICPCSGGTLSAIAHGASGNLIQRAADVHLKEGRKLILVPRETPLSLIQIDNMRRCVEAGAVLLPAMPGFYHGVQTVQDLVDFVVARICDQLGVEHGLVRRWGE